MSGLTSSPSTEEHGVSTHAFDKEWTPWWWLTLGEEDNASLSMPIVSIALLVMVIGLILNVLLVLVIVKCAVSLKKVNLTFPSRSQVYKMGKDRNPKEPEEDCDEVDGRVVIQKLNQMSNLEIIDESEGGARSDITNTNSSSRSLKTSML